MEVGQRPVLGDDQRVAPAVVVEVADGQPPAQAGHLPGVARAVGGVDQLALRVAQPEPGGHGVGQSRPAVVDVAVGGDEVEPAVVVGVEERHAEPQQIPAGRGQPDLGGVVEVEALAGVAEQRGPLGVEVRDGQVHPAVAVLVAEGHPHPRLERPRTVGRDARGGGDLLEPHPAQVAEVEIRRRVVGDEEVDPPVVVEVAGDHAEPPPLRVDDPGLGGHVDEPAGVVAEQVVGQGLEEARVAVVPDLRVFLRAGVGGVGVPGQVVADIEVEVAVVVEVGEGGGGRPVAVAAQPGGVGRVLEGPVAPVAEQGVRPPSGDEQVGVAVVVEVADRHAVAIPAGQGGQARGAGDVAEMAVPEVAEQPVLVGEPRRRWREDAPLDRVDVEPAVAVEVEQGDAAAHRLGELTGGRPAVVVGEDQARRLGVVGEPGDHQALSRDPRSRAWRGEDVGHQPGHGPGGGRFPRRRVESGEGRRRRGVGGVPGRGEGPPAPGVEPPAQGLGEAGELGGTGCGFVEAEHGLVARDGLLVLEPTPPERRDAGEVAPRGRQLGQPLERRGVARAEAGQGLEGPAFRPGFPLAVREPGHQLRPVGRVEIGRREVRQGPGGLIGLVGGDGPFQPGSPDGRVVGPASGAVVEPPGRLVEVAQSGGEVAAGQPDPVVVGRGPRGPVEEPADPVDGIDVVVVIPEGADDLDRRRPRLPAVLDEATDLRGPPLELEEQDHPSASLVSGRPRRPHRPGQLLLDERQLAAFEKDVGDPHGGRPSPRGTLADPGPAHHRPVDLPQVPLGIAERQPCLVPAPGPPGQPSQPLPRRDRLARADLPACLRQFGTVGRMVPGPEQAARRHDQDQADRPSRPLHQDGLVGTTQRSRSRGPSRGGPSSSSGSVDSSGRRWSHSITSSGGSGSELDRKLGRSREGERDLRIWKNARRPT